jgi:hypothetical protein
LLLARRRFKTPLDFTGIAIARMATSKQAETTPEWAKGMGLDKAVANATKTTRDERRYLESGLTYSAFRAKEDEAEASARSEGSEARTGQGSGQCAVSLGEPCACLCEHEEALCGCEVRCGGLPLDEPAQEVLQDTQDTVDRIAALDRPGVDVAVMAQGAVLATVRSGLADMTPKPVFTDKLEVVARPPGEEGRDEDEAWAQGTLFQAFDLDMEVYNPRDSGLFFEMLAFLTRGCTDAAAMWLHRKHEWPCSKSYKYVRHVRAVVETEVVPEDLMSVRIWTYVAHVKKGVDE